MARPYRHILRRGSAAVAALAVSVGLMGATASVASASTTTATIPTSCAGVMHRLAGGHLYQYTYRGTQFSTLDLGTVAFAGTTATVTTFTMIQQTDTEDVYLAVLTDGSLWRMAYNGTSLATSSVSPRGWGSVRHLTASLTGTRLYALTTTGGLYRYSLNSAGRPTSLGAIATTGWGGIKFLSPASPDGTFDSFVGVASSGALREYLVNRSTGSTRGSTLSASGWGGMKHISVGSCGTNSSAAPLIGILTTGDAYGYYDANAFDLNGSDISGVGKLGHGFTGLLAD
ncbi:hypothetical protein ABEG17_07115 [Pedococcus sp. KACC 23699]|uniref:Uncharacterized protein n=1 Tax=Pedococcus sp. KACC 23699 TaxID=3149228 RepID=A0AAU7JZ30_9MICO